MVFLFSSLLPVRVTTISKAMQTAAISKTILCWYVLKSGIICKTYERKMLYSSFCPPYLCTFASDKSCLTETHRKSQNLRPLPSHYLILWEKLTSGLFLIYSCYHIDFFCKKVNWIIVTWGDFLYLSAFLWMKNWDGAYKRQRPCPRGTDGRSCHSWEVLNYTAIYVGHTS